MDDNLIEKWFAEWAMFARTGELRPKLKEINNKLKQLNKIMKEEELNGRIK